MSSARSSPEESVVEPTVSSPRPHENETDPRAANHSPLNQHIPQIPPEQVQPLVVFYWDRAAKLAQRESKEVLAEMFLEVISTLSNLILKAFRNLVLEGRAQERPLLVSEEAVSSALDTSLTETFRSVPGSTQQPVNALSKLVSVEVTAEINTVLRHSRVLDKKLVVPEETKYRPPKSQMKAMVRHARAMLRSAKDNVRRSCGSCVPTERHSATSEFQDEAEPTTTRLQSIKGKLEEPPKARPGLWPMSSCCTKAQTTSSTDSCSKSLSPHSTAGSGRIVSLSDTSSLSVQDAIAEVDEILLAEAKELTGEEERSLRADSLQTATDIVASITDELSHIEVESGRSTSRSEDGLIFTPCLNLKSVANKIQAFFALCCTKTAFRSRADPAVSPDEVADEVASKRMRQSQLQPRTGVQMSVDALLSEASDWLHQHTQLPSLTDPVQRVLGRIRRIAFRMVIFQTAPRRRPQPVQALPGLEMFQEQVHRLPQPYNQEVVAPLPPQPTQVPLYLQPSVAPQEKVVPSVIVAETPKPTPDVPRVPSPNKLDPSPKLWSGDDCNALVYEVVLKIFKKKFDPLSVHLSRDLLAQLEDQISEWTVVVKPSRYKDVASAVYKDLCKGQQKVHVQHAAVAQRDFSAEVLDTIRRRLTTPEKPTLCSM